MAGGIIPRGGKSFALGAADLEEKWLPRADHLVSRMPIASRFALRLAVKFLNYFWPIRYMKRFRPLTGMTEKERTALFHKIENSGSLGAATLLLIKILIFPAFYGLGEVKEAIGYAEKFPDNPYFEGLKD